MYMAMAGAGIPLCYGIYAYTAVRGVTRYHQMHLHCMAIL